MLSYFKKITNTVKKTVGLVFVLKVKEEFHKMKNALVILLAIAMVGSAFAARMFCSCYTVIYICAVIY